MPHRNASAVLQNAELGFAIENSIAIAASAIAVVTVVAIVGYLAAGNDDIGHMRVLGRYGLVFTAFLLFTSLLRHRLIGTDTYMTLAAGALGAVGGYQFHKRGHEQARGQQEAGEVQQQTDGEDRQSGGDPADRQPTDDGGE